MDCVYVVRKSKDNDELRYSLRSLKNLPHRKVVIVGHRPHWCVNVVHIETEGIMYKWAKNSIRYHDAELKWYLACLSSDISANFYAFNDDFYIMNSVDRVPNYYRGFLDGHNDRYGAGFGQQHRAKQNTAKLLTSEGIITPKDFELHIPMIMNKAKRLKVNELMRPYMRRGLSVLPRSVYGNLYKLKGEKRPDVKNIDNYTTADYLSTDDKSFNTGIGEYIKSVFPNPSPYEVNIKNV